METLKEIPEEKVCIKCGIAWPLASGFYNNKKSKDGKIGWCIQCCNENNKETSARRHAEPMSPQATSLEKLYAERFRAIKAAGLSMDKQGVATQNKIDTVLKKHGLFYTPWIGSNEYAPVECVTVVINNKRFKGGNKKCKTN